MLACVASTVVLDDLVNTPGTGGPLVESVTLAAAVIPAIAVGTLLAARRPGNPIGWLLLAILFLGATPTEQYDILAYRMHPGTVPLGWVSVVLQECWPLFLGLVAILIWLFPDGKLPTGRWRRPSVTLLVSGLLVIVVASSGGVVNAARHDIRVDPNGDLANPPGGVLVLLQAAAIVLPLAAWLTWIVVQIPTYRHAGGERRQQLKWLYAGAAVSLAALAISVFIIPLATGQTPGFGSNAAVQIFFLLALGALPVSMGVAVLKYRLYELDRIISRVVSYTVITALLAAIFAGLVLLATRVLPIHDSVSVAASTLVTAALFNPLRRRVQHAVDRRFNRARYNAEAIVETFTARLRNNVDLDALQTDLIGVVDETVQPTRISMWLAPIASDRAM